MGQIDGLLVNEMPREKLVKHGPNTLTDVELLAILLRTGSKRKNVLELSREILTKFDTETMSRQSYEELLEFDGINIAKATLIVALFELSRRLKENPQKKLSFNNSCKIYDFVKDHFLHLKQEKVMILHLNSKNKLIKHEFISEGGLNQSLIDPKILFKKALIQNASGIILVHNHPSGDSTPSQEDITITQKIKNACQNLDIRFLDHLIIGDKYTSLFDQDLM